jgi:hypothetical protein
MAERRKRCCACGERPAEQRCAVCGDPFCLGCSRTLSGEYVPICDDCREVRLQRAALDGREREWLLGRKREG